MPKQLKIYLTHEVYQDIPGVIQQLKELTGTVTMAQITADALRERLSRLLRQKEKEARRGKA